MEEEAVGKKLESMYKLARATGHVILLFESAFMQQEEHVLLGKESFEATTYYGTKA